MRLRVASWNVFKGQALEARDGRNLAAGVAACASLRQADVLLVQEAVIGKLRAGAPPRDAVAALARAFGLEPDGAAAAAHVRFLGEPHGHDARWGVAILSRHPARFHDVPLPRARWSPWPRGAIVAEVGPFLVATLHLEVWPIGATARREQIDRVLAAVAALDPEGRRPAVVAGDFNCERGAAHRRMAAAGFRPAPLSSWTWAFGPFLRLRLDHAYVRGARVVASGVERAARGSDHRPIWAEVEAAEEPVQTVS